MATAIWDGANLHLSTESLSRGAAERLKLLSQLVGEYW